MGFVVGKVGLQKNIAMERWQSLGSGQLHYIAAMQPSDSEMEKRISRHQEDRRQSGWYWKTWETARFNW